MKTHDLKPESRVWKQTGFEHRFNYIDLCLKLHVILFCYGQHGSWADWTGETKKEIQQRHPRKQKSTIKSLENFCEKIKCGDTVILCRGEGKNSEIHGVGKVVGEYQYCKAFHDVDGWNMSHVRRVQWLWQKGNDTQKGRNDPPLDKIRIPGGKTVLLQDKDGADEVRAWLEHLETGVTPLRELCKIPDPGEKLNVQAIADCLSANGVVSDSTASISCQINEIIEFEKNIGRHLKRSEDETIVHFVVPLLRSLGWTKERIAVQWNSKKGKRDRIDVALFNDGNSRNNESLSVIVEVKKAGYTTYMSSAFPQAARYADGKDSCRWLIATDGLKYGVFQREDNPADNPWVPYAYVNLKDLRDGYPVLKLKGAKCALLEMAPKQS